MYIYIYIYISGRMNTRSVIFSKLNNLFKFKQIWKLSIFLFDLFAFKLKISCCFFYRKLLKNVLLPID